MSSSLIRMANDIAVFHMSFPQDEAAQMVSEHINKFWAPSLRRQLFELVQTDPGAFSALVVESLKRVNCDKHNPVRHAWRETFGTG